MTQHAATERLNMGEGSLKRVVSALILVPAVLYVLLFASALWLLAAVCVVTLLGVIELNRLGFVSATDGRGETLGVILGCATPPFFYVLGTAGAAPVLIGSLFLLFLNSFRARGEPRDVMNGVVTGGFGIVYIALPLSLLVLLREMEAGRWWILYLFLVIWASDSFAYYIGKNFGRRKLCSISPKKTIEGVVGGVAGGVVAAIVFVFFFSVKAGYPGYLMPVLLSFVVGAAGVVGDLAESLIKRSAGKKDSGSIIPGHGGVLDRIDSLLFAIPVLYYALLILGAH